MRVVRLPAVSLAAAVLAGLAVALASLAPALASGGSRPFGVRSASLAQDGRQLVWRVELDHAFSASGLKRYGRTLCLLIGRRGLPARLCVLPSGGRGIALVLTDGRKVHRIAAAISRSGPDELTAVLWPGEIGERYRPFRWQVLSTVGAALIEYPRGPALAKLHTPRLAGCVPAGPPLVYSGSSARREIALTFDDGPWDDPPSIEFVKLLAHYRVPASFFEIGDQIGEYDASGAVEREMLANGDMIGDHTWTHPDMAELPPARQRSELELTIDAIRHATGFTPCLWRPPYGAISPELISLARSLGLLTIMWNVDPRDWAQPGTSEIIQNVVTNSRDGSIVEEHFGGGPRYETLDALPTEISDLRARGYRFVNVAALLGLRLIYK